MCLSQKENQHMNLIQIFGSIRAANRMSTALANGRRPDPVDVEQLGLTDVMKRRATAQTGWPDGNQR